MRYWLLAFALVGIEGFIACAATPSVDKPTSPTHTTSGFYGPGYGGNTAYGQTNGPSGEATRGDIYARPDGGVGDREKDQNGGDIMTDPISR